MKTLAPLPLALFAALAVAGPARADDIDAAEYLPLGAFNAWEMIDKGLWADGAGVKAETQVLSVGSTSVVDGVTRYNIKTSSLEGASDAMLQFSVDNGVLSLHGARILDPDADFGLGELSVPAIFFDAPVPIGDATTALDADFAITDITSQIEVELDLGFTSLSGDATVTGTVASRWNAVAPIHTPLGNLGASGGPLAELELDFLLEFSSDDDGIGSAIDGSIVAKSLHLVLAPGIGFVQITGKSDQLKILNRAILPGALLSNSGDPDAFPTPPPGDLLGWEFTVPTLLSLDDALDAIGPGGITDGVLTLDDLQLEHGLGGALRLTASASAGGAGPVEVTLVGKAKPNAKTGGLKLTLAGKTKKLVGFAKNVKFTVKQELASPFGSTTLNVAWNAGKDPITKLLVAGTLAVPVTPFTANSVNLAVPLPVDVPKLVGGLIVIDPVKHALGAEGVLTLGDVGSGREFAVILREKVKAKSGLPAIRTYTLVQTGKTAKLFGFSATSTGVQDYALTKLKGKLLGVKIAPLLTDVTVTTP